MSKLSHHKFQAGIILIYFYQNESSAIFMGTAAFFLIGLYSYHSVISSFVTLMCPTNTTSPLSRALTLFYCTL